jgi:hypothetical protein
VGVGEREQRGQPASRVAARTVQGEHQPLRTGVAVRRGTAQQHQPAEKPVEDQIEQAKRNVRDHALQHGTADRCGSQTQADFWNPTGSIPRSACSQVSAPWAAVYCSSVTGSSQVAAWPSPPASRMA